MVAGGGASVIYADTVGDLGYAHELGNYAEYSGAPSSAETYAYAKTLIDCATANADDAGRALVVGGGIANFTDVAATFKGIIQVKALQSSCCACYVMVLGPLQKGHIGRLKHQWCVPYPCTHAASSSKGAVAGAASMQLTLPGAQRRLRVSASISNRQYLRPLPNTAPSVSRLSRSSCASALVRCNISSSTS